MEAYTRYSVIQGAILMQDKKPRHTQITSEHTRGRKVKYYRSSESVAGGGM